MLKRTKLHQIRSEFGEAKQTMQRISRVSFARLAAIRILLIIYFYSMCCVENQQCAHLMKVSIIQTFILLIKYNR